MEIVLRALRSQLSKAAKDEGAGDIREQISSGVPVGVRQRGRRVTKVDSASGQAGGEEKERRGKGSSVDGGRASDDLWN